MTNGSCHSTCESNVQPYEKPRPSAARMVSTTALAGGSVCRTTPKSMSRSSVQVLRQLPREELSVAGAAVVLAALDEHATPRQHRVHPAGDPHALVRRVVHVHVVRLDGQGL